MAAGSRFQVTATALRLRAGPDLTAGIVDLLAQGEIVTTLDDAPAAAGWLRVESTAGRRGYASAAHLQPAGAPTAAPAGAVDIERRNTEPAHLHPRVRDAVLALVEGLRAEDIPLRLYEGFRPPERQRHLLPQGAKRPRRRGHRHLCRCLAVLPSVRPGGRFRRLRRRPLELGRGRPARALVAAPRWAPCATASFPAAATGHGRRTWKA